MDHRASRPISILIRERTSLLALTRGHPNPPATSLGRLVVLGALIKKPSFALQRLPFLAALSKACMLLKYADPKSYWSSLLDLKSLFLAPPSSRFRGCTPPLLDHTGRLCSDLFSILEIQTAHWESLGNPLPAPSQDTIWSSVMPHIAQRCPRLELNVPLRWSELALAIPQDKGFCMPGPSGLLAILIRCALVKTELGLPEVPSTPMGH